MAGHKRRVTPDTLRIQVVEDSAENAAFAVRVRCRDPSLLGYWKGKALFCNGQVEQVDAPWLVEGGALEFALRVLHRSARVSNVQYWSPFTMALCLDALFFHYRLAPGSAWLGNDRDDERRITLVLVR